MVYSTVFRYDLQFTRSGGSWPGNPIKWHMAQFPIKDGRLIQVLKITRKDKHRTATGWPQHLSRGGRLIQVTNTAFLWAKNRGFENWPLQGRYILFSWRWNALSFWSGLSFHPLPQRITESASNNPKSIEYDIALEAFWEKPPVPRCPLSMETSGSRKRKRKREISFHVHHCAEGTVICASVCLVF